MEMPTIKEVPVGQHGHYSFSSAGALRIFMFSFIGAFSTIDKGTQQNWCHTGSELVNNAVTVYFKYVLFGFYK